MVDELLISTMEEWRSRILKSKLPAAVEFFSTTCPYCAKLTPIFRRLSTEYGDRMNFALVNATESQGIAEGYGVMGVPTIKIFCDGRTIYEIVGFKPEDELKTDIERVLRTHKKCISESSPLYA